MFSSLSNIILSFFVLVVLSLTSCSSPSYLYAPTDGYLVGLDQAGDVKVSGGFGRLIENRTRSKRRSLSYQLAFSPLKNVGIQGSLTRLTDDSWQFNEAAPSYADIRELVVGHYSLHGKKKEAQGFTTYARWENYVGMGWGKIHYQRNDFNFSEINFRKFIFQTGISAVLHPYFEVNIALRPTYVQFDQVMVIGSLNEAQREVLDRLARNDSFFFPETSLRLQGGSEQLRVFISTTRLLIRNNRYRALFCTNDPFIRTNYSMGVTLELNSLFRKRKNKS